ncbi:SGNH/GDSL hydrolase family protein [Shewanella olleyana]|uniref:SGNH/GDSL hydrolase family protein n=1 Tax=Shewanella olleyana TaxID=135626 RepID=UPI00200E24D3|nr:SGNH/GDSL hydrolase family protein [Shewanella olleyana]MCL1067227.1 SGNH/GDSL hydrolase family protein [Shewanella olleyana]
MIKNNVNERQAQYLPDQIVLLGDSIFDNAPYVESGESVTEQLNDLIISKVLESNHDMSSTTTEVKLLAVDGHVMSNVSRQMTRVQSKYNFNKQHAFLSCGGNDLLGYNTPGLLSTGTSTVGDALNILMQVREKFRYGYQKMLNLVQGKFTHLTICTIYDGIPNLSNAESVALAIFNEVILREAAERNLTVLDLRVICNHADDYAPLSPIEPSKQGAEKIAQAIFNQYKQNNNMMWEVRE